MNAPVVLVRPDAEAEDSAKRRQIIDGARAVFLSMGFDGASMGEIARAARVSKGTLYVYFKDKDELFKAIAAKECVFQAEGIFSFDEADPDVEAVLMRVFTGFVKALCEPGRHSSLRTVIAIADRMPEVGQMFYQAGPAVGLAQDARLSRGGGRGRAARHSRLRDRRGAAHRIEPRHPVQADAVQLRPAAHAGADRIRRRHRREGVPGGLREEVARVCLRHESHQRPHPEGRRSRRLEGWPTRCGLLAVLRDAVLRPRLRTRSEQVYALGARRLRAYFPGCLK